MKGKIITWNTQGINSTGKNKIKALIHKWQADVYCFQETKMEGNMEIKSARIERPELDLWLRKEAVTDAPREMLDFSEGIEDLEFVDPALFGGTFTWNKANNVGVASSGDVHFRSTKQFLLPRINSDHTLENTKSYFKFENWWLEVEGHTEKVTGWWDSFRCKFEKLQNMRRQLGGRDPECFGYSKETKTQFFPRMANVHKRPNIIDKLEIKWRIRN
ncbi:hypothetical protein H5410_009874 [Solanum commersonii]|uniref:Endonuclease/exonuclease/phosphatase domain-containing protein n=1 Tax=Solanum commersonii TaxID=4109 RepID=A0A9J6AJ51_SOLCO|nr:hypothetical protein H5410_009874 [Solanum commersonii]